MHVQSKCVWLILLPSTYPGLTVPKVKLHLTQASLLRRCQETFSLLSHDSWLLSRSESFPFAFAINDLEGCVGNRLVYHGLDWLAVFIPLNQTAGAVSLWPLTLLHIWLIIIISKYSWNYDFTGPLTCLKCISAISACGPWSTIQVTRQYSNVHIGHLGKDSYNTITLCWWY